MIDLHEKNALNELEELKKMCDEKGILLSDFILYEIRQELEMIRILKENEDWFIIESGSLGGIVWAR